MAVDVWDDSAAYESYVGRWSRLIAARFIAWLDLPRGGAWLDVGCGTGALTREILATANPRLVIGCDRSPAYIAFAGAHTADSRTRFVLAELSSLPQAEDGFDAVVAGLVLNFLPSPLDGLIAMAARARRGGVVAAYVWDYAGQMQLMRYFWDAAVALNPSAEELDEGRRFPICNPQQLEMLFRDAALAHVESRGIDVPTRFENFDDYWSPFLGGQGPAPGYTVSLSEEERAELRERIHRALPVRADGSIDLIARAWAVRGSKSA
jgi:SAM-dependent methyltransferase